MKVKKQLFSFCQKMKNPKVHVDELVKEKAVCIVDRGGKREKEARRSYRGIQAAYFKAPVRVKEQWAPQR